MQRQQSVRDMYIAFLPQALDIWRVLKTHDFIKIIKKIGWEWMKPFNGMRIMLLHYINFER